MVSVGCISASLLDVGRDRLLAAATGLSGAGAVFAFLLGLGAGLSEDPGFWADFVFAGAFAVVAILCGLARTRD